MIIINVVLNEENKIHISDTTLSSDKPIAVKVGGMVIGPIYRSMIFIRPHAPIGICKTYANMTSPESGKHVYGMKCAIIL